MTGKRVHCFPVSARVLFLEKVGTHYVCLHSPATVSRIQQPGLGLVVLIEVVLRYFYRCRYWSSTAVVLLLEGHRLLGELAIREYGGHEDLRGSDHRSVIPYVHDSKELCCCVLVLD
jgi:hypothetical protein